MDEMDYLSMEIALAIEAQDIGRNQNDMVQKMREIAPDLIASYLNTSYTIYIEGAELVLKVRDMTPKPLRTLVESKPVKSWAIITAYNPYSKKHTNVDNLIRQQQLEEILFAHGYEILPAIKQSNDSDWEDASVLILGISYDLAKAFGSCFQQNAIIYSDLDTPILHMVKYGWVLCSYYNWCHLFRLEH